MAFGFPRSRSAVLMLLSLLLLVLSVAPLTAQEAGFYYYADGERIPLTVSARYVAAEFAATGGTVGAEAAAQGGIAALDSESAALQPGAAAGLDFVLLPLAAGASPQTTLSAAAAMRSSGAAQWVNPVFELGSTTLVLMDEFIAGFPAETPQDLIETYNAANRVEVVRELSPGVYLLRVTPAAEVDALTMANRYQEGGVARYGEPNWALMTTPVILPDAPETLTPRGDAPVADGGVETQDVELHYTPNDQYYANGWHLNNFQQYIDYQSLMVFDADIDAKEAWDTQKGSNSVLIAVLDDGVQTSHPDLDSKIVFPYDAIGGDFDPQPYDDATTRDWDAHGTHVAGLAAAESDNTIGITGVCMECRIIPIRIFYSFFDAGERKLFSTIGTTVNGINWAVNNGASVINSSWGDTVVSTTINDAFRNAAQNGRGGLGSVLVFTAGNDYKDFVSWPGRLSSAVPGAITVGASTWCDTIKVDSDATADPDDCTTDHSWGNNWGSEVGIAAPGHFLPSTDLTGTDGYVNGDYTGNFSGTSGAAPIVAGAAGLVIAQNPTFTNDQVRDRLYTTADPLHTTGYDVASGWGRLNTQKAILNVTTNTGTPNDHRTGAATITALPFNTSQSVLGAFVDRTDPSMSTTTCAGTSQAVSNTVWFEFIPAYTMSVNANTFGSNYNTVLGVYDETLTEVMCNNDFVTVQSQVNFTANFGTTYYFMVGDLTSISDPIGSNNPSQLLLNVSTSTPPPAGEIDGSVTLQGRPTPPDTAWVVPLHVVVKPTAGGAAVYDDTLNSDTSGGFTISSLANGEYNIWVKGEHTLANLVTQTISGTTAVNAGTLREGDANDDNTVSISDFSILATAFGSSVGGGSYDARADFNGDGSVTIADFSLLASNFGQSGAAMP